MKVIFNVVIKSAALIACSLLVSANAFSMNPHFVLTGGPGVGKSSVIALLAQKGYCTAPEAFTELHQQAAVSNSLDQLFSDPVRFRRLLMDKQIQLEAALSKDRPAFLDRCRIDVEAFGNIFGVRMPQSVLDDARAVKYPLVFFLEQLPQESYKQTEVRREGREEATAIHNALKQAFLAAGCTVVDVPFDSVEHRAEYILAAVQRTGFQLTEKTAGKP